MSAARLAAETAFRVSSQPSPEQAPTVTVRRSRVPEAEGGAEAANAEAVVPGGEQRASKEPRVFRLGPSAPPADDADGADAGQAPERTAEAPPAVASPQAPAGRPKRRVAAVQRPGPVVQIFKAEAEPHPGAGVTRAQVAALAAMLAGVQSILDDVQRARAFRVEDGGARAAGS